MTKLQIISSSIKDGIMSKEKKYFKSLTTEERQMLYQDTKKRFLNKLNLDITKEILVKNNIKVITSNNINIPVLTQVDDNPVLVASTTKNDIQTVAVTNLTLKRINDGIITKVIDELMTKTDAAPFEMTFYIGPCPAKEDYIIKDKPNYLDNSIWSKAITKEKDEFHLDLRYAIFQELVNNIVDPNYIYFDEKNTVTNKNLFSSIGNKEGKNLSVVVFTNE